MSALSSSYLPHNIALPMLELVQDRSSKNGRAIHKNIMTCLSKPEVTDVIVDIPEHYNRYQVDPAGPIAVFRAMNASTALRVATFASIPGKAEIYAAVSLIPTTNYQRDYEQYAVALMNAGYNKIAFVVFEPYWIDQINGALSAISQVANLKDVIFIFQKGQGFQSGDFSQARAYLRGKMANSVVYLVHSPVPSLTGPNQISMSGSYQHCTSLPFAFGNSGFSGFGDYAGVPILFRTGGGGQVQVAATQYLDDHNAHKCMYILTNSLGANEQALFHGLYTALQGWKNLNLPQGHLAGCPGCRLVDAVVAYNASARAALNKRITMMHYLTRMIENLSHAYGIPLSLPDHDDVVGEEAEEE